jgi:hypothetical protein
MAGRSSAAENGCMMTAVESLRAAALLATFLALAVVADVWRRLTGQTVLPFDESA